MIEVRVPATTANLGPAFDSLGLALDLWNETRFSIEGEGLSVAIEGEGVGELPKNQHNLVAAALMKAYHAAGQASPQGLRIECLNNIPLRSGLGSSSAAVLTGILGANALMGNPLDHDQVLSLAVELEGHADNIAAAMYGSLVIVSSGERIIAHQVDIPAWQVAVVLPNIKLKTKRARQALPDQVARQDAVFNLGRSLLVVAALLDGNAQLLADAMEDRLHESYRYALIPGAKQAIAAAREMGAAAALSGAGPSVAAFVQEGGESVAERMAEVFSGEGLETRRFVFSSANRGAQVNTKDQSV